VAYQTDKGGGWEARYGDLDWFHVRRGGLGLLISSRLLVLSHFLWVGGEPKPSIGLPSQHGRFISSRRGSSRGHVDSSR
jgi:hypothetical protein